MNVSKRSLALVLLHTMLGMTGPAFALDARFFAGHIYMYERSDRFESVLGGAVTYLTPSGNDEFEVPADAILVEGVLSAETLSHVRRLMSQKSFSLVFLNSPGGDLNVGIAFGHLLRDRESTAIVSRGAQCKSACALAFLGAPIRIVAGDSSAIGFHRQYRIVGGKVSYGDLALDRRLIDTYLRSIDFQGITGEEIAATTGEATFSEPTLKQRGVITLTHAELRAASKEMVEYSGVTSFELLSVICAKYDGVKMPTIEPASLGLVAMIFSCTGRVPAMREPLIATALSPLGYSPDQERKLLRQGREFGVIRSTDPAVVKAYNIASDPIAYEMYSEHRREIRDEKRPP